MLERYDFINIKQSNISMQSKPFNSYEYTEYFIIKQEKGAVKKQSEKSEIH